MRSVYFFDYDQVEITNDKIEFFSKPSYVSELRAVEDFQVSVSLYQYFSDLDEYQNGVKKLYLKGTSEKLVPKQTWDITTRSFITDPAKYLDKYDIQFKEF